MSRNGDNPWGTHDHNNNRRVYYERRTPPTPQHYPEKYIPQPHHCYHQIEKDRMHIQNRQLVDDLHRSQVENQALRRALLAEQMKSVVTSKIPNSLMHPMRKRKPRNRNTKKRTHQEAQPEEKSKKAKVDNEYKALTKEEVDVTLKDVFAKLFTLSDIIELENHPHRPCLEKNSKYAKLLEIIPPVKVLHELVGLKKIKEKAFDIIAHYTQIKAAKTDLMHMVIEGPPGVGKTEVGRLLGKVILGLGVLKTDKFVCARRSDLIGEYLGQTAPKTQQVINSALGGVLFIDEAYSLGHPEKRDSFSKECIDTLNQNLTEKKGEFLCIIAGYEDELESCFFQVNKGLQRRFPIRMKITGYTASELYEIFMGRLAKESWTLADATNTKKLFEQKHIYFKFFAGDTETLFNQAKFVAAGRLLRGTNTVEEVQLNLTHTDVETAYNQCFLKREDTVPQVSMYM